MYFSLTFYFLLSVYFKEIGVCTTGLWLWSFIFLSFFTVRRRFMLESENVDKYNDRMDPAERGL